MAALAPLAALIGGLALVACAPRDDEGNSKAPEQTSPLAVALEEFDRACGDLEDVARLNEDAGAAGWQAFEPAADSEIGKVLAFAQDGVEKASPGATFNNWSYRKTAGDRYLILVVSELDGGERAFNECRVYDLDAPAPADRELRDWAGEAPTRRLREEGVTALDWEPGFRNGLTRIGIVHLEPDAPIRQRMPGVGLAIMAIRAGDPHR